MFMKASIHTCKVTKILGLDLAMDHPNTHPMVRKLPVFIQSQGTESRQVIRSFYHHHIMDTLSPLAHTQVQYIRQTTTVSTRCHRMELVSGVSQFVPHKLVILAGNVRPNATKADRSANIARTTTSSAFTEMSLFGNGIKRIKQ
jgi:hypothetical protein